MSAPALEALAGGGHGQASFPGHWRTWLVVAIAAALSLLAPAAAHAVADDATPRPEVLWPIPPQAEMSGPAVQIAICSGTNGIRRFAREADRKIGGIRIYTGRHACRNHPRAARVRVVARHYGDTGWYAETSFPDWDRRRVEVNLDLPNDHPHAVVCHEFGHVLGLQHHRMLGVDGRTPNVVHFSRAELKALRAAYPA